MYPNHHHYIDPADEALINHARKAIFQEISIPGCTSPSSPISPRLTALYKDSFAIPATPIVNAYGIWAVDPSRVLKALAESLSIRIMVFNVKDEILTELLPTPDAEIEFTAYVLCVPTISNVTKAYALEATLPILTNNNAPEEVPRQNRILSSYTFSYLLLTSFNTRTRTGL
ncbi:hypothetical protein Tco_1167762 [Tanacetum coccineum]